MKPGLLPFKMAAFIPDATALSAPGMPVSMGTVSEFVPVCSLVPCGVSAAGPSCRAFFANGPARAKAHADDAQTQDNYEGTVNLGDRWSVMLSSAQGPPEESRDAILRDFDGAPTKAHIQCIVRLMTEEEALPLSSRNVIADVFSHLSQEGFDVSPYLETLMDAHENLNESDERRPVLRRAFLSAFSTASGYTKAIELLSTLAISHYPEERRQALTWIQDIPLDANTSLHAKLMNDTELEIREAATKVLIQRALSEEQSASTVVAFAIDMMVNGEPIGQRQAAKLLARLSQTRAELVPVATLVTGLHDPVVNDLVASSLVHMASIASIRPRILHQLRHKLLAGSEIVRAKAAHILGELACGIETCADTTEILEGLALSEDARTKIAVIDAITMAASIRSPLNPELATLLSALGRDPNRFVSMHAHESKPDNSNGGR